MMIYEHVQLMIQTFSLSVLDPSKQRVAVDIKKMIVELVGHRDQALARKKTIHRQFCFERQHLKSAIDASCESSQCQWNPVIRNPVMSILDVSPLHLALSYLSDVAASVVKHRKSLVDGTADKTHSRKEPLFASLVLSTGKDANNVSQDKSNNVSTASPALPGQLHPKKTLAATLVESSKKETIALVPFDIARLAQRFYPLFNFFLFPRKPPPAAMVQRVNFTDAEDGLLALGILELNSDWDAIQKRFLPCKSTRQIYVRQKNRTATNAPDNPVKEVRRMKNSPLSTEEIQRVEEGLKIFKNDWTSVWKFNLPYRDPAQLQRQWRVATGVQRSYSKSDSLKEKRRAYEAKRRKRKASMPDSRVDREQEADNDASEGVESDDDLYANEALLADTENRSVNMMQTGTRPDDECGAAHGCFDQHSRNSLRCGLSASYIPFSSCASDGPSTKRVFDGTLDELQASQIGKEKGSHVVKLAPDLPAVNLPPSVRIIPQKEFDQNAAHFNGTSDNAEKDLFPVSPPTFTECVYTQLNLFPDHSTSDRLEQHGTLNGSVIEDGYEQDFLMHPLNENLSHSRNYDLFPFENVPVEKSNKQKAPANANTVDFHPLLQRTEAEMHGEVPEEVCHQFANQSDCHVKSISKLSTPLHGSIKGRASISNLDPGNACSHRGIEEPSEEAMQGVVMEQEELSDSEEDSQHVVFECEEIDDSEEEQVKDAEPCLTGNKGTSASVVCLDFQESNDQGLEQVAKQGASLTQKSHGSSIARSGRAKLKPEKAMRMGTRRSERLASNKRT
ncbi:uncharacterized protein LOC124706564 [Lolium rigidum]|uniref:uncharacterized protein LOC124706564 n=1 Tax=Lolium rigidum TaxID=89674 RepID=UPI001F5C3CE9|nr:uncharacterized protein LOC124706564 [Lolium rigidum]